MPLTAKQEKFARLVALGNTQADAYREAYSTENMTDNTLHVEANKTASLPNVSLRIEELKAENNKHIKKKHNIELDDLVGMILEAAGIARGKDDANNLRGAAMDIAKLTGQIIDKKEVTENVKINDARKGVVERLLERNKK